MSDFSNYFKVRSPFLLVGCGNMGGAILKAWLDAGTAAENIYLIDPAVAHDPSNIWVKCGVKCYENANILREAHLDLSFKTILIAVKPQIIYDVLPSIAPLSDSSSLILSVAAGVPLSAFKAAFGHDMTLIRVMPNTPAQIGRGVSALYANKCFHEDEKSLVEMLFECLGHVMWVDEEDALDGVTAISGSGPAYLFLFTQALEEAAQKLGFSKEQAQSLARLTVSGSAELMMKSDASPEQLRHSVTSPKGTTEAALAVLMEGKPSLQDLLSAATQAAYERAKELSKL